MIFAKEFFDLQYSFAERVNALSGIPLERALFEYTNLYVRFGLGREFNIAQETWQAYVTELFEHRRPTVGEDVPVVGVSWLYNLEAYRRLFPPEYGSSALPIRAGFRSMPLWGQFLDRHGKVRESMTRPFLRSLGEQSSLADIDQCFPLPLRTARAAAAEFYQFYEI